ncbi:MAG: hypothetical protein HY344_01765 [Candidatus Levybacteria bacterium]|nr:hypothetical protein [Candidatus Levybacteria bacterium]
MHLTRSKEGRPFIRFLRETSDEKLAEIAAQTGGDARIDRDRDGARAVVLWERGGIRRDTSGQTTETTGRGMLAHLGPFLDFAVIITRPNRAFLVLPSPDEQIDAYRLQKGRMTPFTKRVRAGYALKMAARMANNAIQLPQHG